MSTNNRHGYYINSRIPDRNIGFVEKSEKTTMGNVQSMYSDLTHCLTYCWHDGEYKGPSFSALVHGLRHLKKQSNVW